jgi:demethylmenaquinone methyltransferase/2-methoxy-6-polyprenyl-1,4-benzoquinol methylase
LKSKIETYYSIRATEYEKIYDKPERQDDLSKLKTLVMDLFKEKSVLEIACGTGYWSEIISNTAHSILAIDTSEEVLKIARAKSYNGKDVKFKNMDAFSLSNIQYSFDAAFCGFWLSHVQRKNIESFIINFHTKLKSNSIVVLIDNNYVEGSSTPVSRKDGEGNTYQLRKLQDGSEYEVLKNFYLEDELNNIFKNCSVNFEIINLKYYWMIKYNT